MRKFLNINIPTTKTEMTDWRRKIFIIIFGTDTRLGRFFDISLIITIVLSIIVVILETMNTVPAYSTLFVVLEYFFTIVFTLEYALRIYSSPHPWRYIFSFFGIVDLLSTLPMYLGFFFGMANSRYFIIMRTFRLMRIFRVFRLFSFMQEGNNLLLSIKESSKKILVFFLFLIVLVISIGTLMYIIENRQPGSDFTDIPNSIYWAIVTMTTVGYGDITPVTLLGRVLSGVVMLLGYTIIAVPTGIVSVSMMKKRNKKRKKICPRCHNRDNDDDASFCKKCGEKLIK